MEQVASRGYGTSSEYVRELIRKDRERQRLRSLLLEGAGSAPTEPISTDCENARTHVIRRERQGDRRARTSPAGY